MSSPVASPATTPLVSPRTGILVLLGALALVMGGIELLVVLLLGVAVAPSLHVAVFFVSFDMATGAALLWIVGQRIRLGSPVDVDAPPSVSVLIAAYNEAGGGDRGVVPTVREVVRQTGVALEVLVGDDGSEDGTCDELVRAFSLKRRDEGGVRVYRGEVGSVLVRVFSFAHAGKGATLNALAAYATNEVLVTLDADTSPGISAIARLASAFVDPRVESAAGIVSVRNARSYLTRHQYAEYVKNSIVRIGWSAFGALEQVPGAFAGIRATAFRAVSGFPTDSLTEDYELTYRLVDRGAREGRVPVIATVLGAQAFTDVPVTVKGFIRQRTRWFAGFLSTLFRFRHLIGRSRAGGFGVIRLPLKLVDAVLPLIAFASLAVVLRGALSSSISLSRVAIGLFALRWLWDLVFYGTALRYSKQMGDTRAVTRVAPRAWQGWLYTATEALTYVWLKHAATLRAYTWAVRRARTWEPSREALLVQGGAPALPPPASDRAFHGTAL